MVYQYSELLGHFRKKVTSDGICAGLGTEARGTESLQRDSHVALRANGGVHTMR